MAQTRPQGLQYNSEQNLSAYFNMHIATEVTNTVKPSEHSDVTSTREQGIILGIYCVLLVVGAVGNVSVLISLARAPRKKSRINLLMTHLVMADLIVNFIGIPLEIGWRITDAWLAGHTSCKIIIVLREFGLYLSTDISVCMAIDRYFAIVHPLKIHNARISTIMLYLAWMNALLCSLLQILVFRVIRHPKVSKFEQCVSFERFGNQHKELAYDLFGLCAMFFLPLLIMIVCSVCMYIELYKKSKENAGGGCDTSDHGRIILRRSTQLPMLRARQRTLRMTITIVTVFTCCGLPYAILALWYMIDRDPMNVPPVVKELFYLMAVSNSCMNPLVYWLYTMDYRTFINTLRKFFCIPPRNSNITGLIPERYHSILSLPVTEIGQYNTRQNSTFRQLYFEDIPKKYSRVNSEPSALISLDQQPLKRAHSCDLFMIAKPRTRLVSSRVVFTTAQCPVSV